MYWAGDHFKDFQETVGLQHFIPHPPPLTPFTLLPLVVKHCPCAKGNAYWTSGLHYISNCILERSFLLALSLSSMPQCPHRHTSQVTSVTLFHDMFSASGQNRAKYFSRPWHLISSSPQLYGTCGHTTPPGHPVCWQHLKMFRWPGSLQTLGHAITASHVGFLFIGF